MTNKNKKNLVVLSGAGISEESGIRTFREMGGLWEQHDVMEVASPEGWANNRALVLDFYNQRRKQLREVHPNAGHQALVSLEASYHVTIITQNVDNLHERAGSSEVVHLHGELTKVRSTVDDTLIQELDGWELKEGDLCKKGSQLRPHIVWFGEEVPMIDHAISICQKADLFLVVGTSLNVYPAAGLLAYIPSKTPIYLIDPEDVFSPFPFHHIKETASVGLKKLFNDTGWYAVDLNVQHD